MKTIYALSTAKHEASAAHHPYLLRDVGSFFLVMTCAIVASIFAGCTATPPVSDGDLKAALERVQNGADPLVELTALDQKYPQDAKLKAEIAGYLLGIGEMTAAETFLEKSEALGTADAPTKSAVSGARSRIFLLKSDFDKALEYAERALREDPSDPSGAVFSKGRALAEKGKAQEARAAYDSAVGKDSAKMTKDDWRAYIKLLAASDPDATIKAIDSYEAAFPYEPGTGLVESAMKEKKGDMEGAVLAAFMDLEYARELGAVAKADLDKKIADLGAKLGDKSFNPSGKGFKAVGAIKAFLKDDLAACAAGIAESGATGAFAAWLRALAPIAAGKEADQAYADLGKRLASFPAYWVYLATGSANAGKAQADIKAAAEKGIDLAPKGPYAPALRSMLAKLTGLGAEYAARIKTNAEIKDIGYRAASSRSPEVLESLWDILSLPDNEYTLFALGMVKGLSQDPRFLDALKAKLAAADGRLKERLTYAAGK